MTHILPGDSIIGGDVIGVVVSMHASKTINTCTFVTKLISELNFCSIMIVCMHVCSMYVRTYLYAWKYVFVYTK